MFEESTSNRVESRSTTESSTADSSQVVLQVASYTGTHYPVFPLPSSLKDFLYLIFAITFFFFFPGVYPFILF